MINDRYILSTAVVLYTFFMRTKVQTKNCMYEEMFEYSR